MEDATNKKATGDKSSVKSPNVSKENFKVFGNMPETKKIDAIDKTNTPEGRSRAPESVGF